MTKHICALKNLQSPILLKINIMCQYINNDCFIKNNNLISLIISSYYDFFLSIIICHNNFWSSFISFQHSRICLRWTGSAAEYESRHCHINNIWLKFSKLTAMLAIETNLKLLMVLQISVVYLIVQNRSLLCNFVALIEQQVSNQYSNDDAFKRWIVDTLDITFNRIFLTFCINL